MIFSITIIFWRLWYNYSISVFPFLLPTPIPSVFVLFLIICFFFHCYYMHVMHLCVFRTDHWVFNNQVVCFALGKTICSVPNILVAYSYLCRVEAWSGVGFLGIFPLVSFLLKSFMFSSQLCSQVGETSRVKASDIPKRHSLTENSDLLVLAIILLLSQHSLRLGC